MLIDFIPVGDALYYWHEILACVFVSLNVGPAVDDESDGVDNPEFLGHLDDGG